MNNIEFKNREFKSKPFEVRKRGLIPGIIYGPKVSSRLIIMTEKEFNSATSKAGEVYRTNIEGSNYNSIVPKYFRYSFNSSVSRFENSRL